MGRPPKEIKYKFDHASGRVMVCFAECPDRYFMTRDDDLGKALSWARRNKPILLGRPSNKLLIKNIAKGFFDLGSEWYQGQLKKGRKMTHASLAIRQGHIVNYIIPLFGEYTIEELTGRIIDDALLDIERVSSREGSETKAALRPLAKSTKNKILYSIKLMYHKWVSDGIATSNPTDGIVKYSKDPERPRASLPPEVIDLLSPTSHGALVRLWGSSMWGACMLVLYDTGSRSGEPRAVKWGEYYPDERYMPLRHGIEGGTKDKRKGTKTDIVKPGFLQARTVQELEIWRSESRYNTDEDYIFTVTGKAPITSEAINQKFKKVLEGLGYDATGWTPYWLRHTFITEALRVLDDEEIMMLVGHTSLITNAKYRHPTDAIMLERARGIRAKLDKLRGEKSS